MGQARRNVPCPEPAKTSQPLLPPLVSPRGSLGHHTGERQAPVLEPSLQEPQPQWGWEGTAFPEDPLCAKPPACLGSHPAMTCHCPILQRTKLRLRAAE